MARFILYLLVLALPACAAVPVHLAEQDSPALMEIRTVFETLIRQQKGVEEEEAWHSGWWGNMVINTVGGENMGLCHHWQQRVYDGVESTVSRLGWQAEGVSINRGTYFEHHAVLVYDPGIVRRQELLHGEKHRQAWVLDGWRRGRADIYTLKEWLTLPLVQRQGMQIEGLQRISNNEQGTAE